MNFRFRALFIAICLSFNAYSKNYITLCKLEDQFGGQLFFTAMALGIAWDNDLTLVIPKETYLNALNGPLNYELFFHKFADPSASHVLNHINPEHIHYNASTPYQYKGGDICISKLQTELWYFQHHQEKIRQQFAIPEPIMRRIEQKYHTLINHPKTVAVHIRAYHPTRFWVHAFLGIKYYKQAMRKFPKDHIFVVFSDRIDWCKKHFAKFKRQIVFIEGNDHVTDLFLMSMCKNVITANSTFSWWAAYLRKDLTGRVIVPSRWFRTQISDGSDMVQRGLYPSEWEVVPVNEFPPPDPELLEFSTTSIPEED